MKSVQIGNRTVGHGHPVFVIAEIGANFRSLDEGLRLVEASADAGVDAVKLQTYRAATLTSPTATMTFEDGTQVSQFEFFNAMEVSDAAHVALQRRIEELNMVFFSTPAHPNDVDLLESLHAPVYKIGSDDVTNHLLLRRVAGTRKPIILSTGMCTLGEVEEALNTLARAGNDQVVLLHCVVGYPARVEEANLRVITTLQDAFQLPVGFSDHTRGSLAAVVAVTMGATVVEKHLAMDRSRGGPDDLVACEPDELKTFTQDVRGVRTLLGDGRKRIMPGEEKWRKAGRKSIVAVRHIEKGQTIAADMIDCRRPSDGLHPRYIDAVVGRRANADIPEGAVITWGDLAQ